MTTHRATNWAMAAIIAACMSTAYLLDAPAQVQPHTGSAKAAQADHAQAQRQARFERAARKVCGANKGAFEVLADGVIQCLTQGGFSTITTKVAL